MTDEEIASAARRHGLSEDAGEVLFRALVAGGGRQAQFSHPDLGGMGQWSGGMTQVGDMFNDALKAKVTAFCQELADAARSARADTDRSVPDQGRVDDARPRSPWAVEQRDWWPDILGAPSSSGSQNGVSYACFPDKRRLAISDGSTVTIYDTGNHRLSGFSQAQSTSARLSFSGQNGPVPLDSLKRVDA